MALKSRRYVAGSASQFDGTQLLREAESGVVAVIIQYRLGLFGARIQGRRELDAEAPTDPDDRFPRWRKGERRRYTECGTQQVFLCFPT